MPGRNVRKQSPSPQQAPQHPMRAQLSLRVHVMGSSDANRRIEVACEARPAGGRCIGPAGFIHRLLKAHRFPPGRRALSSPPALTHSHFSPLCMSGMQGAISHGMMHGCRKHSSTSSHLTQPLTFVYEWDAGGDQPRDDGGRKHNTAQGAGIDRGDGDRQANHLQSITQEPYLLGGIVVSFGRRFGRRILVRY